MEFLKFISGMEATRKEYSQPDKKLGDQKITDSMFYIMIAERQKNIRAAIRAKNRDLEKRLWMEYCGLVATYFSGELRRIF